ncbi:MAG: adenylyltransferase/cytidyltransferase family protein [Candidatus Bathyarchaeia archaeon]|jgi:nicotinamide-nucleotide adenylyltransferase
MKTTGFFWGRFNPPHKGHVEIIRRILRQVDDLIVVIGASQNKNTKSNPFSGEERKQMLEAYLKEEELDEKVKIIPLPDSEVSIQDAVRYVLNNTPKFDVSFSTHEIEEQLTPIKIEVEKTLEQELNKRKIKIVKFRRMGTLSSSKIREAIAYDKKWEYMTGKSVVRIIKELNGIERIKKAHNSSYTQSKRKRKG